MKPKALITGASAGIGLEFAKVFSENGYDLILTARRYDALETLKSDLENKHSNDVRILPMDLTQPASINRLRDEVIKESKSFEILINNAGVGAFGKFWETKEDTIQSMIDLNITALTRLTRKLLPIMLSKKSGTIMNVASTAGFQPGPMLAVYYATKAYVLSFTEALSNELRASGVHALALCPGPTATEFHRTANSEGTRLLKYSHLPTAKDVAEFGYQKMIERRTVAIHGMKNNLLATLAGILPRTIVTNAVRWVQEKPRPLSKL